MRALSLSFRRCWLDNEGMSKKTLLRAVAALTVPLLGAALSTTATAAPKVTAAAAGPLYVALGDSYASGDGAGSYLRDGTSCYRSLKGYPGLIATAGGYALNLQACSGAKIGDVTTMQLSALDSETAFVTVTVGGNDIGFASTLTTCLGTNTTACYTAISAAEAKIAALSDDLEGVFKAIKQMAPNAKIVATAYPRLFNGKDCSILTSFTSLEMSKLNAGADKLAVAIQAAAVRATIGYAEVRDPFVKHAVCDSVPWIRNAQLFSQYESFHPNASGYLYGYKPAVTTALGATTSSGATMTVKTGGTTSSDTSRGTVRTVG